MTPLLSGIDAYATLTAATTTTTSAAVLVRVANNFPTGEERTSMGTSLFSQR